MLKGKLISCVSFLFIWIVFGYAIGIFEHFRELPMSVHQSAQCDRASLAQNYYFNGFRLLYPEVNEDKCSDGIVSCELPLSNYLAACLYKIFSYDEFWFRLLSYLFITAGMFCLFLVFRLYLNVLVSYLLILLINSSPVILFYSANFLPDISSLGLMLVAWLLFFRMYVPHAYLPKLNGWPYQVLMIICLGLGIASKTTSVIQWLSMLTVLFLSNFKGTKIQLSARKNLAFTLLCGIVIPVMWFFWSRHLSLTHNSQYFMMRIPHSETLEAYWSAWHVYLANWPAQTFSEPLVYIATALFIVQIALKKFISPVLWALAAINFVGSAAFLCLMIEQFKYHDYYIICLFPAFIFNWLALADASRHLKPQFWWVKVSVFILVCLAFNHQFYRAKINLAERYTPGNYWEQSHLRAKDYDTFRLQLESIGIDRQTCALVGYDNAPNNMLYLLHLTGHRYSREHDDKRLTDILSVSRPAYLVSNDSSFTEKVRPLVRSLTLKKSFKYLNAYAISY